MRRPSPWCGFSASGTSPRPWPGCCSTARAWAVPPEAAGAAVDMLHVGSLPALTWRAGLAGRRLIALDVPVELFIMTRQLRSARSV